MSSVQVITALSDRARGGRRSAQCDCRYGSVIAEAEGTMESSPLILAVRIDAVLIAARIVFAHLPLALLVRVGVGPVFVFSMVLEVRLVCYVTLSG
jgi:hypothetical protein